MEGAAQVLPSPPAAVCGVLLDAPNEVSDPDFGLFRDVLNQHFYPARVEPLERRPALAHPRITAAHLSLATLAYVAPGTTASVDPGDLSAYHVNVALSGSVASQCGDQEAIASAQVATVFSPDRHTALPHWAADAAQLSIKLPRHRVEEELAALLGRPIGKPIDFQLAFPVDDGAGRRWISVLSALLASVDTPDDSPHRHHLELLERSLISGLLLAQPHSTPSTWSPIVDARLRRARSNESSKKSSVPPTVATPWPTSPAWPG